MRENGKSTRTLLLIAATSLVALAPAAHFSAAADDKPAKIKVPDQPEYSVNGITGGIQILNQKTAAWYAFAAAHQPPKPRLPHPSVPHHSTSGASTPPRTNGVNWDGIAQCETGGNWSMHGSRFSGGLGFYNGTWNSFGGTEFASNAGDATREQQIIVAERVYARFGLSGWGCRAAG